MSNLWNSLGYIADQFYLDRETEKGVYTFRTEINLIFKGPAT